MTNQFEASKDEERVAKGKVERRLVFVSHSHADRELASALKTLIDHAFSGVVEAYVSSDPGPTGGIMPGEEWYSQIAAKLRQAEAVWVLATPTSVKRPWIYWEAGTGRALCPGGIVVLRVKLGSAEVPSPLRNFQSYDGLKTAGVVELVGKVANQIGLKPTSTLTETCAKDWVTAAAKYEPLLPEAAEEPPTLTPERLDRLDAALARLEAISMAPEPAGRMLAEEARERAVERDRMRRQLLGAEPWAVYESVEEFVRVLENAPTETTLEFRGIDSDGDARILAIRGDDSAAVYLDSGQLRFVEDNAELGERTRRLLSEIAAARDRQRPRRALRRTQAE